MLFLKKYQGTAGFHLYEFRNWLTQCMVIDVRRVIISGGSGYQLRRGTRRSFWEMCISYMVIYIGKNSLSCTLKILHMTVYKLFIVNK